MKRIAVLGYGAVGRETAALFAARGDDVIVAQRHAPKQLPMGVRFAACDVTSRESVTTVCAGRDVAICAVGFPYDWRVWERTWPAAIDALLSACEHTGARFVFADNLYMAGPQTAPLTEDLPLTNYGQKPRIRSAITRLWQAAHVSGRVRAVAVRGSDFYGPDVSTSVLSAFGVARLLRDQAALIPYSPDFPHDFTYVPDFAHAIVTLADASDDAYGQAWNVPNAPTHTLRELLTLSAQIARVRLHVRVIPGWLMPVMGLFSRDIHELIEMRFQTDRPYRVDATKYKTRFGGDPTPFEQGLGATIEFYRRTA
ncbi:MAG: NAD-dependent epimerase/dehydratase family protein [Alphaproteobacteria bacterium]|nr:NAD-dependent epimerase/dehydratase family protein [Alphaproteobacteria bacterium]